jgi:hypothetical protein
MREIRNVQKLDLIDLGCDPIALRYEDNTKSSKFLDQMNNYKHFKEDPEPWS